MEDMGFLFNDPRPDIVMDAVLWNRLLKLIPTLENRSAAAELQRLLWSMRSAGTMLKPNGSGGIKFAPLLGDTSEFDNEEEFEQMKKRHLGCYATEITILLKKVMEK